MRDNEERREALTDGNEEKKGQNTANSNQVTKTKRRRTTKKSGKEVPLYEDDIDKLVTEKGAIDSMEALRHIMQVCDIQIARFMKLIQNAQQAPEGLVITGTSQKKEEVQGTQRGAESDFSENQTVTNTMASYELILRYNNEIEKAKREKLRCLEILLKLSSDSPGVEMDDGFLNALSLTAEQTWHEQQNDTEKGDGER